MKYAFIQRHKLVWPICVQCRVLLVSVSGYHEHLARRVYIAPRRHLSDPALLVHISAVYAENRGAYGWPRIWRQLRAQGIGVGKQRQCAVAGIAERAPHRGGQRIRRDGLAAPASSCGTGVGRCLALGRRRGSMGRLGRPT